MYIERVVLRCCKDTWRDIVDAIPIGIITSTISVTISECDASTTICIDVGYTVNKHRHDSSAANVDDVLRSWTCNVTYTLDVCFDVGRYIR